MQFPADLQEIWHNLGHVAIAYLLTATIGWGRERERRSVGVRTFPIVEWQAAATCLRLRLHA